MTINHELTTHLFILCFYDNFDGVKCHLSLVIKMNFMLNLFVNYARKFMLFLLKANIFL